eukprot:12930973-Prorocentrum_lima.AAC.1
MLKPWIVKTNCPMLGSGSVVRCDGKRSHTQCRHDKCKSTENGSNSLATRIHMLFAQRCSQLACDVSAPAAVAVTVD